MLRSCLGSRRRRAHSRKFPPGEIRILRLRASYNMNSGSHGHTAGLRVARAQLARVQGNTVYRFHQALLLGFTALLALLLCAKGHVGRARSTSGEGGAGPRH